MSYIETVKIQASDSPTIDAFARLRVSEPSTVFDSKQLYDSAPLFWSTSATGTGTSAHSVADASTTLSVTTTGDKVIRQSKMWHNYQPGKSQFIFTTFVAPQETTVTKKVGLYNGIDGICLQIEPTDVKICIMKNGTVTESVSSSAWNVDKFDGSGASGTTINFDLGQIFWIDMEWLGVGRVRTGFVYRGIPYVAHEFNHSNETGFSSVYMSNPNLPIRYEIESAGSPGTMQQICCSVMSEGGQQVTGKSRSIDIDVTTPTAANGVGTNRPLLALRLKSGRLGATVIPRKIGVIASSATTYYRWYLSINPIASGTQLTAGVGGSYTSITNSSVEYTRNFTDSITDEGTVIASGIGYGRSDIDIDIDSFLRIGSDLAGTSDILVLSVINSTGNISYYASLTFNESE